ncbi:MAG: hypothetical protein MJZ32_09650 [Bacteroidaceae bacterium]|nr:hypothetical protein [Bacteroidaceae bacterium]
MKTNGFISLHRQLLTWQWHNNPTMMTVWMHLLLLAEYEDTEYCDPKHGKITIRRGECLVSLQWLAQQTGISIGQMRTCISTLETAGEITRKRACNRTLIKITHYADYQASYNTQETAVSTRSNKPSDKQNNKPVNKQNDSIGINNNKYNNKNLSDGEIKTTPTVECKAKAQPVPVPEASASGSVSQLRTFATALWQNTAWLELCCKTYSLPLDHVQRYAIAFYEQMRTEQPNKTWLSNDDFCRHFLSWLKFQSPQKVRKYLNSFRQHKQRELWRKAEEKRQAEMWREIEESKRKAVSYEEYLRGKRPERAFAKRT